jgi:hypothetical protein
MERMPFNTAKLPTAPKRYDVFLHDLWLGESTAVSPEKAINNVVWTHGLYWILTRSELDELYARESA